MTLWLESTPHSYVGLCNKLLSEEISYFMLLVHNPSLRSSCDVTQALDFEQNLSDL